jgi:H+-transporting ATPase
MTLKHPETATSHSATQEPEDHPLDDLTLQQLQTQLGVTPHKGLSQSDVDQRRAKFGYNELPESRTSALQQLLSHFWGPIPWMIEIAVILSAIVQDWADFAIILVLLVGNGLIGFWEEYEAGNAIAALKAQLALNARVKREGQWQTIPARELVPGDVVHLRIGDVLPADIRLLPGDAVDIDQSALTGESLPVSRGEGEAVYSGSVLKRGESDGIVYAIGAQTFFGRTARLVDAKPVQSHFQQTILRIGNFLIAIAFVLVMLILFVALYRHDSLLHILKFVLVLTVASIPVAMPTVLSATMAIGARLLARKDAIVSRLEAIEEIAGMDILCSDKTGTLTLNQLTLGAPVSFGQVEPETVVQMAALASKDAEEDPIDKAVMAGVSDPHVLRPYQVTKFLPFDPVIKRTEATVSNAHRATPFESARGHPR